ncbi:Uncharacterised protein [Escherichia coli]|uniref:Uncharacterized protein n=1 Tax=Escherichia coli TaxID=562 RepID=A0A376WA94_ECOLX|nr:Uncharacterised protein [Escherichia coli]
MALEKGIAELVEEFIAAGRPHRANKYYAAQRGLYRQRCPCG